MMKRYEKQVSNLMVKISELQDEVSRLKEELKMALGLGDCCSVCDCHKEAKHD